MPETFVSWPPLAFPVASRNGSAAFSPLTPDPSLAPAEIFLTGSLPAASGSLLLADPLPPPLGADGMLDLLGIRNPPLSGDPRIDGVLVGRAWNGVALSYSFPDSASDYENPYGVYNEPWSAPAYQAWPQQRTVFQAVFEGAAGGGGTSVMRYGSFEAVSGLQFTNFGTATSDIRIAITPYADPTAYAYYPADAGYGGDIWFGRSSAFVNPILGDWGTFAHLHEAIHAMGLKGGHEIGPLGTPALPAQWDSVEFTVGTYRSFVGAPLNGYSNETYGFPQTLMMLDIAALQYLYGANWGTNAGNTNYRWDAATGEMSVDGVGQGRPGANRVFVTIWDGGGIDTYDMSNYATAVDIDLAPERWSTTAQAQRAVLNNYDGYVLARGNVFNALQYRGDARSLIENALGGSADDRVAGNSADNGLRGGAGNDRLSGLEGADTLEGGTGNDVLDGGPGGDWAEYGNATGGVVVNLTIGTASDGQGGTDTLVSIENVIGSGFNDTLTGVAQGQSWSILRGGSGNDTLNGIDGQLVAAGFEDQSQGMTVNLASGTVTDSVLGTDTLVNIRGAFMSGAFDDTLTGTGFNDVLAPSGGNDIVDGGAGRDVAVFNADPSTLRLREAGGGVLLVEGGALGTDRLSNIEAIQTTDGVVELGADLSGLFRTSVGGDNFLMLGTAYVGPVATLQRQLFGSGANEVYGGTAGNDFMNLFAGDDAANAGAGDDVVDGGLGSNFMSGGAGRDVFFSDGRAGGVTWTTIADWEVGEQLSVWGWRLGVSRLSWAELDGVGDYKGVTMRGDLDGNGEAETIVTWTGKTQADLPVPFEFPDLLWFVV